MSDTHFNFWETVSADAAAAALRINAHAPLPSRLLQTFRAVRFRIGFACVFWLRVNQWLIHKNYRGSFRLRVWRQYRFANDISPFAKIGPGLLLPHTTDINIGSNCVLGKNVTLYNGVALGSRRRGDPDTRMPHLEDNVVVYSSAKVIGGVTIGENSEIGALTLCNKDVPKNSVAYGIPPNFVIKPK